MSTTRMVALLRGINVGGHRPVPMAQLRQLAADAGLIDVTTYVQSGNLVFGSDCPAEVVRDQLEEAIVDRFGFAVDVAVRTRAEWGAALTACPFPDSAQARPKWIHVGVSRETLRDDAATTLAGRCAVGEAVAQAGGVLWVDYGDGPARSKLTPAALDKAAGSPLTARNWRTAVAIAEMLG